MKYTPPKDDAAWVANADARRAENMAELQATEAALKQCEEETPFLIIPVAVLTQLARNRKIELKSFKKIIASRRKRLPR